MTRQQPLKKGYSYFVGIDVSKHKLNYAAFEGRTLLFDWASDNSLAGFMEFQQELRSNCNFKPRRVVYGLEHTGIYNNKLIHCLTAQQLHFVVAHSLNIKNSLGMLRGKSDKVDARRIALYLFQNRDQLTLYQPRRSIVEQLSTLRLLRNHLQAVRHRLTTEVGEQNLYVSAGCEEIFYDGVKQTLLAIERDYERVNLKIDHILEKDENIHRLLRIITSVPGVGKLTAIAIIISTNEFNLISSPKKFACYCGVAPFPHESGKSFRRPRILRSANLRMKSLMHICAITSVRSAPDIKAYFERKVAEGKPRMAIYNAIRNKLIHRIFACVKNNRLYSNDVVVIP